MSVMRRQRVQQAPDLVRRPVVRYIHAGRIHLKLCQKRLLSSISPSLDPALEHRKWQSLNQTLPPATPGFHHRFSYHIPAGPPPDSQPAPRKLNKQSDAKTTGVPTTPPTTDVRSPRLSALSALQAVRSAFDLHLRLGGANEHFGSSIISAAPASSFCERSTSRDSWIDT